MVRKLGLFGNWLRSNWKVLKCDTGGWRSWTDRVNNETVLHRVNEERNILHTIRRRKANWIGHNIA
jgi:hypothetical protein